MVYFKILQNINVFISQISHYVDLFLSVNFLSLADKIQRFPEDELHKMMTVLYFVA